MFWSTTIERTPAGHFYLRMTERDYEGFVTDVDEPACSAGLVFETVEAIVNFAEKNGIRLTYKITVAGDLYTGEVTELCEEEIVK